MQDFCILLCAGQKKSQRVTTVVLGYLTSLKPGW